MSLYKGLHICFGAIIRGIFRVKVEGGENLPDDGAYIVACNHICDADPVILAASVKNRRQIRFMAKKELFKVPLLAQLIKALGAFPIDRGGADVGALKHSLSLLKNGEVVGIFPQGTRYPKVHPVNSKVRNGVGMLAKRSGAMILPACIETKNFKILPFFRRTYVRFGTPYTPTYTLEGSEAYQEIAQEAFTHILELINAEIPRDTQ
ncbi:MAG: 1-acyl-sn-glycerol-3-phosphate acyltransferase [Ruminococcaceae bacterium]|nr:1-acyl-sn-glycerol-3-phosphate acyltransferase [Oscillospiraceae bacterium]